jgi:hypothetical protein
VYPGLIVPQEAAGSWRAALLGANARPACDAVPEPEAPLPLVCAELP